MMIRKRNNNGNTKWQTPLPTILPSPTIKKHKSRRSGDNNNGAMAICSSLLCILLVLVGSIMYWYSSTIIPASIVNSKVHVSNLITQKQRRFIDHTTSTSIKYVNLQQQQDVWDVVVVGCGPAGLTSALFASRMGLSVLVLGSPSEGSLSGTDKIDNFPSFFDQATNNGGQSWIDITMNQAYKYGAQFASPTIMATGISQTKVEHHSMIEVQLNANTKVITTKSIIVATGSTPNKLNLPHESTLWGQSLHNCALCDGDVYLPQNGLKKSVVVIGGGDAAVEAVLLLHNLGVHHIHWIHRRQEYKASSINVERIHQLENVDVWSSFVVVEWIIRETNVEEEEDHRPSQLTLEGVRIVGATSNGDVDMESTSSLTIPCDGAFLMIGSTPKTDWLEESGIDVDPVSKLIRLSKEHNFQYSTATSIQGVFAAGEVVDDIYRQALTASSDGAKAAIDAQRYLHSNGMETTSKHNSKTVKQVTKQQPKKEVEQTIDGVDCDLSKASCIELVVSRHPVVVFSKSYCPYCRRALEAIRSFSSRTGFIEPLVIDLTELSNMPEIQNTLGEMTGRRTVPNVYVDGKSIGGGDETTALYKSGELEGLLRRAEAIQ